MKLGLVPGTSYAMVRNRDFMFYESDSQDVLLSRRKDLVRFGPFRKVTAWKPRWGQGGKLGSTCSSSSK